MRDINRIDRILEKIGKLWKFYPDQRLGQLIDNYVIPTGKPANETYPLRFQEDDETEKYIDGAIEYYEEFN